MSKARPRQLDSPLVPPVMKVLTRAHVWIYRATSGLVGGRFRLGSAFPRGVPVCLLTTRGRRSGRLHTTPLLYLADDNRIVLVASQGGLPRHPAWYYNVTAHPDVTIQIKQRLVQMRARVADDGERAALWPRLVQLYADYDTYQSWTERTIPVVICEPVA